MGKVDKVFAKGMIGDVIFYTRNGKPCVRSKPAKVKQTKASKASSKQFGKVKTISRLLRSGLSSLLENHKDLQLMYRVDNAVKKWLQADIPNQPITGSISLPGFDLYTKASLKERFRPAITVSKISKGKLKVTLPAFNAATSVIVPSKAIQVILTIAITSCTLDGVFSFNTQHKRITINCNEQDVPQNSIEFTAEQKPGCITVIAAGLRYITSIDGLTNNIEGEQWNPAAVIAAWYYS